MRLHGTITPDRPLLVVALEEEATHLHVHDLPILVTGIGKVNAAVALSVTLGEYSPSHVVNLGTAGALHDHLAGTHIISRVIQHDFNDEEVFSLAGIHFGQPIEIGDDGPVLATGDAFINSDIARDALAKHADLVDMEGYAVAHAAAVAGVPLTIVKEVSDQANATAGHSWRETVDLCAERLGLWVRDHLLG